MVRRQRFVVAVGLVCALAAGASAAAAGVKAKLVNQQGKEFTCSDLRFDDGWVLKGRGEQASSVEIPFEKIQSIEFLSCQTHQCYLAVIHRTLGELKISFAHEEATVRCDAQEGSGTFQGRDLANIKRIEFSD